MTIITHTSRISKQKRLPDSLDGLIGTEAHTILFAFLACQASEPKNKTAFSS
jgi:hypothetical protein